MATFLQATIHRLNERALALLARVEPHSDWTQRPASWREILPLLAGATEGTLRRAAGCPMTLLDFNFQVVPWWTRTINGIAHERSARSSLNGLIADGAISFAHDLLIEAWSAARATPCMSSLVFGMAPEVTQLIARLSPRDLDCLVMQEFQELKPRWENRPLFWKELIEASTQMDDEVLANVHLHCLQLLGGELASARGKTVASAPAGKERVVQVSTSEG